MKRPLSRTHHLIAGFAGILALSLAQAHAGDWDLSIGVGAAENATVGKGSVGISF